MSRRQNKEKNHIEVCSKIGRAVYFAQREIGPTPTVLHIVEKPKASNQITPAQADELRTAGEQCTKVLHVGEPGKLKQQVSSLKVENAELKEKLAAAERELAAVTKKEADSV